jgi:Tol biopolymer transport system component
MEALTYHITCAERGHIAFAIADSLYLAEEDGSGLKKLSSEGVLDGLQWSPRADLLLYRHDIDRLHLVNTVDGSEIQPSTAIDGTALLDECRALWSPDGSAFVFEATLRQGATSAYELFVYDVATDASRRLTNLDTVRQSTPGALVSSASWSPSGDRVAYCAHLDATQQWDLLVVNADGTGRHRLTDTPGSDCLSDWSPDAQRLVFASERTGRAELFTVSPAGEDLNQLTTSAGTQLEMPDPTWSPDGLRVAFLRFDVTCRLYTLFVTTVSSRETLELGRCTRSFQWSPHGQMIAWSQSTQDDSGEVYIAQADGTSVVNLSRHAADDRRPQWSPDGSRVAFSSDRTGRVRVFVANVSGSGTDQMALPGDLDADVRLHTWRPQ